MWDRCGKDHGFQWCGYRGNEPEFQQHARAHADHAAAAELLAKTKKDEADAAFTTAKNALDDKSLTGTALAHAIKDKAATLAAKDEADAAFKAANNLSEKAKDAHQAADLLAKDPTNRNYHAYETANEDYHYEDAKKAAAAADSNDAVHAAKVQAGAKPKANADAETDDAAAAETAKG